MNTKFTFFAFLLFIASGLAAQGFSGGFKAGLNFNSLDGPLEMNADGMSLEELNQATGFHVGATFAYGFTDLFGVKADLMYSQKGGEQRYEGQSFFYVYGDNFEQVIGGTRRSELDIINSYIEIPVMVYYKLGPLEISGGASAGFLVSSAGSGGATYTNTVYGDDERIIFNYESNFFRDPAQLGSVVRLNDEPVGNTNVRLPSVIGAYYNNETDESLFRRLDLGLVVDLAVYLNSGLYIGARYNLGLTDVTKAENDLAGQLSPNLNRQFRDDDDRNRSLQLSVGFRF